MRKRSMLALLAIATFAAAVAAGLGTSVALAGESTGNCGAATDPPDLQFNGSDTAAANCKGPLAEDGTRVSNGNSWCSYSGQNDYPDGSKSGPAGRTQSFGQDVKLGLFDPSTLKGGFPGPGTACNPQNPNNFGGGNPPPRK
jgi:hypothetical protein